MIDVGWRAGQEQDRPFFSHGPTQWYEGRADWRDLDLSDMPVSLAVNCHVVRNGSGRNGLGDPLEAFVWLANAHSRDDNGVKSGDIHNPEPRQISSGLSPVTQHRQILKDLDRSV